MSIEQMIVWGTSPLGIVVIGGGIAVLVIAEMVLLGAVFRGIGRRRKPSDDGR